MFPSDNPNAPKAPSISKRYTMPTLVPAAPANAPALLRIMRQETRHAASHFKIITGLAPDPDEFEANAIANAKRNRDVLNAFVATDEEIAATAASERAIVEQKQHDSLCYEWERVLGSGDRPHPEMPPPPPDFVRPEFAWSGPEYARRFTSGRPL